MNNISTGMDLDNTFLGIELGSTRIKAVLINDRYEVIASGGHDWENSLVDGIWTYSLNDIWCGLQDAYAKMASDVKERYGKELTRVKAMGLSAMMHGYMAFDDAGELLVPFRTWRNTITEEASELLTKELGFHIPQRWTSAHLFQAALNQEAHLEKLAMVNTLAGYLHWKLTGNRVLGVGEASGVFPIDSTICDYDHHMKHIYEALLKGRGLERSFDELFPAVLVAGIPAGNLTAEGALLLDPTGRLEAGIPLCPPEGDAGTGMVATNSVAVKTGNVSAGTSVFAMVVLEEKLKKVHDEIDIVTTPSGESVAMVHCNNCTSDLNAWVKLFREFAGLMGFDADSDAVYGALYENALQGAPDCGGLLAYNYFSGEHVTGFNSGRPLFVRQPDADFSIANFMRTHLYASLASLKAGLDILLKEEKVAVTGMLGHGGLFKTRFVGQKILADAINAPVTVMETAADGGAWGIAVLAAYMDYSGEKCLSDYLKDSVFAGVEGTTVDPDPAGVAGFDRYLELYKKGLAVERAAVDHF